ncbi:ABC transporter permease [Ensifer sp. YR511]|uniref:ABC transporter permease n=1 Tax=Ensifer sp. YR511 TaxID=1855294 RepID=UPI000B7F6D35|nr:ABC transporter permease [Ensifer sp. YR511]
MSSFVGRKASILRSLLPVTGLIAVLIGVYCYRPNAMNYVGLGLLLTYAMPVALAAFAQMFVIAAGDIDLSIGNFISLITCIVAAVIPGSPIFGLALLVLLILCYGGLGVLIHIRRLPSIVVTLGFSFIWLGIAVLVLPRPGGLTPEWLSALLRLRTPLAPLPVLALLIFAIAGYLVLNRWSYGTVLRGVGGNARAVSRAGWSVLLAKATLYSFAGFFGVLSGVVLAGITTSGDANLAPNYTLLSVAAVILGGGEFVGGKVSPVGTIIGAVTLVLMNSLLTFMNVGSDWQLAAQGLILIVVLAVRAAISHLETRSVRDARITFGAS